jgi:hypothetical protein
MTALNSKNFRGQVSRLSDRLLAGNYASSALNVRLDRGRLDPIKGPTQHSAAVGQGSIGSLFRFRNAQTDFWLTWVRSGVNVARSPNSQDTHNRLYWTGDGEPRMTTADLALVSADYPTSWYVLGVYKPTVAPTVGHTGGAASAETRSYVYTFRTALGEESAPSPATTYSAPSDATSWDLSAMEAVPPSSGTVSAASHAGGVVTVTMNTTRGLAKYEEVVFSGVAGMTDLNGTFPVASVVSGTQITVELTTAQVYTAGGVWQRRAPHNTTGMLRCIYRTVGTSEDYKYVGAVAATSTAFTDNIAATALGDGLTTLDSSTPPKNGHSIVELANGAHAMLAGNELCISEQGKPHSWPVANRYPFSGTGVAAVAVGNSVVVTTDSVPVLATCTVPEAASLARMDGVVAPNIAKLGTVDTGMGAAFPSHDGLWHVTPSGSKNLTASLFTPEQWQALVPSSFRAALSNRHYYAAFTDGAMARILDLDLENPDSTVTIDQDVDVIYDNPYDGRMYVVIGHIIYKWDEDDQNRYLAYWRSRAFQLGKPVNFSVAQVHAEYGEEVQTNTRIAAWNAAILTSSENIEGAMGVTPLGVYPIGATNLLEQPTQSFRVQFSLVRNGEVVFSRELSNSNPFRLPSGFKIEVGGYEIASTVPVYSVTIAQGMGELREASV